MARLNPSKLRVRAQELVADGKIGDALEAYRQLEIAEPNEGGHAHKAGELMIKRGETSGAIQVLSRAAETYARAGFLMKAIAVCKLILRLDPDQRQAQEQIARLNRARTSAAPPLDATAAARALGAGRSLHGVPLAGLSGAIAVPVAPGVQEIELDDVPIEEDLGSGPSDEERARVRAALAETPFVAVLGEAALARLIDAARLVELGPDEILFRQGDAGDTLYVVESGEVVAYVEGPPRRPLARLGDGAVFGEMALLTDQPRSATIAAAGATRLVAFDRKAVGDTLALEPRATSVLVGYLRRRLVANLVGSSPLFAPFPPDEKKALAARFRLSEASAGATLVEAGARARGLYLVVSGAVDVVRERDVVATLGPGDVFGEISLLEGAAVATVRAREVGLFLVLPAGEFREIIMTHPHVLEVVTGLADDRKRALGRGDAVSSAIADLHLDFV
jgi:CRP-like cAMP-binding protein